MLVHTHTVVDVIVTTAVDQYASAPGAGIVSQLLIPRAFEGDDEYDLLNSCWWSHGVLGKSSVQVVVR